MSICTGYFESPIGILCIKEQNNFIIEISNVQEKKEEIDSFLIKKAKIQLDEFFMRKRENFDLPIKLNGTDFQNRVWNELRKIEYGKTKSYKDIAIAIGNDKASRAVGLACNKNRLLFLIPCHRVIGSNNELTGFACGLNAKEKLLNLEKNVI